MKTLSLTEPWAALVANSMKKIETRSWRTNYRGPLAIHAAKGFPKEARKLVTDDWAFFSALHPERAAFLKEHGVTLIPSHTGREALGALPLGCVIATCRLVACKLVIASQLDLDLPLDPDKMLPPPRPEFDFGNYAVGRFAWILEDVVPLEKPIPAKGSLGLWNWEPPR